MVIAGVVVTIVDKRRFDLFARRNCRSVENRNMLIGRIPTGGTAVKDGASRQLMSDGISLVYRQKYSFFFFSKTRLRLSKSVAMK